MGSPPAQPGRSGDPAASDDRPGLGRDRPRGGRVRRWELVLAAVAVCVAAAAVLSGIR